MPTLKNNQRMLKAGTSSLFIGRTAEHASVNWRLDVREETRSKSRLLNKRSRSQEGFSRPKLFHYIAAGGMRQLRRTSGDDLMEQRRHAFLRFMCLMVVLWWLFYFLPFI